MLKKNFKAGLVEHGLSQVLQDFRFPALQMDIIDLDDVLQMASSKDKFLLQAFHLANIFWSSDLASPSALARNALTGPII